MAKVEFHSVSDNWYATLNADIDDSVTSVVLKDYTASTAPTAPFYFDIDSEILRCSLFEAETPSAGLATLTVTRGQAGTIATAHSEDDAAQQNSYAIQVEELQDAIATLQAFVVANYGATDGIQRDGLEVTEQGTPDMTVLVAVGVGIASSQPVAIHAAITSDTINAPSASPRVDTVEILQSGAVNVVTGVEGGSAPAVTSGALKLAEVTVQTSSTSITNAMITDSRTFI